MLYFVAFGLMAFGLLLLALDLAGMTPGAAGLANLMLMISLVLLAIKGLMNWDRHWRWRHH